MGAAMVISAWKNLLFGCFTVLATRFDGAKLWPGLGRGVGHVIAATSCQAVQSMGYSLAYVLTDPATALLLTSLNPLWAALFGWRLLGDALPSRTIVALGCAVLAVLDRLEELEVVLMRRK